MTKGEIVLLVLVLIFIIFTINSNNQPVEIPENAIPCTEWYYGETCGNYGNFEHVIAISKYLSKLTEFLGEESSICTIYKLADINDKEGDYFFVKGRLILLNLSSKKKGIYLLDKKMKLLSAGQFVQQDSVFWIEKKLKGFYPPGKLPDFSFIEL